MPVDILTDEDDDRWQLSWSGAMMTIEMPEEDAREIRALADAAGVSVEVYIRRRLGFPDEPPP